jgi:hypothetical protein
MTIYKVSFEMRVKKPDFSTGSKENQARVRAQLVHSEIHKTIVDHFKKDVQIANMKVTEEK